LGRKSKDELAELLLTLVPPDRATIGNHLLRHDLSESVRLAHPSSESFELAQSRVEDSAPVEKRTTAPKKRGARGSAAEAPGVISYIGKKRP